MYTQLPEAGDKVRCGRVLYRVDDRPVLLLCGTVPAYRALRVGSKGPDVRQLNRNLHARRRAPSRPGPSRRSGRSSAAGHGCDRRARHR